MPRSSAGARPSFARLPGDYRTTLCIALAAGAICAFAHRNTGSTGGRANWPAGLRAAALVTVGGALTGVNSVIKLLTGRRRGEGG